MNDLVNDKIFDKIADTIYNIDIKCREDLIKEKIISERDYVTALTTRIRDKAIKELDLRCHAQSVNHNTEKLLGIDGIFIFKHSDYFKIGIFEAKRPQILKNDYKWDKLKKGKSHFSSQIFKQEKWNKIFTIWEMFFIEAKEGDKSPPYDYSGSSCVSHDNAKKFLKKNNLISKIWRTKDLEKLLIKDGTNLKYIVTTLLKNSKKHKIKGATDYIKININTEDFITIPLPFGEDNNNKNIKDFLIKEKIKEYLYLDLNKNTLKNGNL